MKAIRYTKYGSVDRLSLCSVEKPKLKPANVIVRVKAASLNSWDWDMLSGKPFLYRLLSGLFKPKYSVLGSDFSGVVEEVGEEVTHVKVGDEVFGDASNNGFGTFAEYISIPEKELTLKPQNYTHVQSAAIPQAALLAMFGLESVLPLAKGAKVLIIGAGGGVGTFVLQFLREKDLDITCVDRKDKSEMLMRLGANRVIDYRTDYYLNSEEKYDSIIGNIMRVSIPKTLNLLNENGHFQIMGGDVSRLLGLAVRKFILKQKAYRQVEIVSLKTGREVLGKLKIWMEESNVIPEIDSVYPMHKAKEAFEKIGDATIQGKVVITME